MSQHKTGQSNLTEEEKRLYWERRNEGVRGQTEAVTMRQVVKDEKDADSSSSGDEQRENRAQRRRQWKQDRRVERKQRKEE